MSKPDLHVLKRFEARAAQEKAAGSAGLVVNAACYLGGPKEEIYGRTRFQMEMLERIAARAGFQHFGGNPQYSGISDFGKVQVYTGPVHIEWFEADGMWACRLGAKRMLDEFHKV